MFYKPPKYLIHFFFAFRPGTDLNRKWSFLVKHTFYNIGEAAELLTNMSDCEDESTSESENEGDSFDSSKDAPEQHQVRTDSNILMPKETKVSKAKDIPKNGQKAAPRLIDNQSATKHALLADQTATTSGASPAKASKVSKAKEIPKKGQKAAPKPVDNQGATKAMASDSDKDVEDYCVIEDANKSASSEYVPCINYANDKVYQEDVKIIGLGLSKILAPQIFIGLRDPVATTLI